LVLGFRLPVEVGNNKSQFFGDLIGHSQAELRKTGTVIRVLSVASV
jgi:hypothetical protein